MRFNLFRNVNIYNICILKQLLSRQICTVNNTFRSSGGKRGYVACYIIILVKIRNFITKVCMKRIKNNLILVLIYFRVRTTIALRQGLEITLRKAWKAYLCECYFHNDPNCNYKMQHLKTWSDVIGIDWTSYYEHSDVVALMK